MKDNGKGTLEPNEKVVKPGGENGGSRGGGGGIVVDGILDNPDPASLIQRLVMLDGKVLIIDNIPVDKARELFERGVKAVTDPVIAELKRKVWEDKEY